MKTHQTFQYKVPFIGVTVKSEWADKARNLVKSFGDGKIVEEISPETRGDGNYYFAIENAGYPLLLLFKSEPDRCDPFAYTLAVSETVRVDFRNDGNRRVQFIDVKYLNGKYKNGDDCWSNIVGVRASTKNFSDKEYDRYELNWASIGSVSIERAKMFADGLALGAALAKECEEQFCPAKKEA